MKYFKLFCIATTIAIGANTAAVSAAMALQENELEESVLAPDEPEQSPNVSTDAEQRAPEESEVYDETDPANRIEFEDDTLILEQENGQPEELIDLSTIFDE